MYNCTLNQIKLSEGYIAMVSLADIIPSNADWCETIWLYSGLIKRINKGVPVTDSAWWKHEIKNETTDISKRFERFKKLYHSIKENGFNFRKRQHVKLLDISKIKRVHSLKGGRISDKYYRINAMKRILICNFLNIRKIPCKVYGVRT